MKELLILSFSCIFSFISKGYQRLNLWDDMEVPEESFHWSSWDSRTCYPRRAFNQRLTDDSPGNRSWILSFLSTEPGFVTRSWTEEGEKEKCVNKTEPFPRKEERNRGKRFIVLFTLLFPFSAWLQPQRKRNNLGTACLFSINSRAQVFLDLLLMSRLLKARTHVTNHTITHDCWKVRNNH